MIRFQAFGVRFCLPLLSLLAPVLALQLGMEGSMAGIGLSLCAHELSHLLAAKLMRVGISEIRIMPFGGSAKIENPYFLSPAQLIAVAAAGPAGNLLLMMAAAALCHWGLMGIFFSAAMMQPSLVLMLFNLLPALPLDGGRILYALLSRPIGQERALKIGLAFGYILAGVLLLCSVLLRIRGGRWNLTFILAAIFILASGQDERAALTQSRARLMSEVMDASATPRPARIYQLDGQTPASEALRLMRPRESTWFIITERGKPGGAIDGGSLLHEMLHCKTDFPLSRLKCFSLMQRPDYHESL